MNNIVYIPHQSRNRRRTLLFGLGLIIFCGFIVIIFSVYVIVEIIRGQNPFPTPEMIMGGLFFLVLSPMVIISTIKDIKQTWIVIRETDIRISKGIRWNTYPYREITEVEIMTDSAIKIQYGDSTIRLQKEDLGEYYDIFKSRLQSFHKID